MDSDPFSVKNLYEKSLNVLISMIPQMEKKILSMCEFPGKECEECRSIFYMKGNICKKCKKLYVLPNISTMYKTDISLSEMFEKYDRKMKTLKKIRTKRKNGEDRKGKKDKKDKKDRKDRKDKKDKKSIYDLPKDIIIKIILMMKDEIFKEYKEKAFPGHSCYMCDSIYSADYPWKFINNTHRRYIICPVRICRSCSQI